METETDFTIAALRLEEKYTNVNNSELLDILGIQSSPVVSIEELEINIRDYILTNLGQTNNFIGPAVYALGKTYQEKYQSLFKSVMRQYFEIDLNSAYQAGIAIENLGVSIFRSISPLENPEVTKQRIMEFLENEST